jgi:hypothetical protein
MSFTSRDKKEFLTERRGMGKAHNTGKGMAGWKQGVPADVPNDCMGVRHATKKPSTNKSEGSGNKCTAGYAAYTTNARRVWQPRCHGKNL